ncbi:MAG TPA: DUF393 domain-containing protein [Geobacteraceae bacterium]|nr:DUF393 domain-containing protein [Geobacteraceae bacterium]
MPDTPAYPLEIFYDGSCSVCAGKMEAYRRKKHSGRLLFVNIAAPAFDPTPYGITLDEFMHEMHAIDREGRVYRGVEAFRVIWQAFPASTWYGFLSALVEFPGVKPLARLAYRGFARIRGYLPESHDACKDGSCRLGKDRSHR